MFIYIYSVQGFCIRGNTRIHAAIYSTFCDKTEFRQRVESIGESESDRIALEKLSVESRLL